MIKVAELVQVYTPEGLRSHLVESVSARRALCGWRMPRAGWWGTGSQLEEEKAALLPLCGYCAAVIAKLGRT